MIFAAHTKRFQSFKATISIQSRRSQTRCETRTESYGKLFCTIRLILYQGRLPQELLMQSRLSFPSTIATNKYDESVKSPKIAIFAICQLIKTLLYGAINRKIGLFTGPSKYNPTTFYFYSKEEMKL